MAKFSVLEKTAELLSGLACDWFFCGGWGLDLFVGRVTRSHKDVDIAVARRDQLSVQAYLAEKEWRLEVAHDGKLRPWREGHRLELPIHTIWCSNADEDPAFLEVLLNEIDHQEFRFRRDEAISMPVSRMAFSTPSGLRVLAPEIILLYKSNKVPEYDIDLQNTLDSLSTDAREWLRTALEHLFVEHPWLTRL